MQFHVYIPVRFGSTRLPGKPLADIAGKPLIQHVYERAVESGAADIVVATDDERIRDRALGFGAKVCMTSGSHHSGTDRLAEAVSLLGEDDDAIIVNLQGDEPRMPPSLLAEVALLLEGRGGAQMATLCSPIVEFSQALDPHVVKVVLDHAGHALYFSRAPVPWIRGVAMTQANPIHPNGGLPFLRHIGVYAYRVSFLKRFAQLEPCPLELIEGLEQLRALYYGHRIRVSIASAEMEKGVDTVADLEEVRRLFGSSRPSSGTVDRWFEHPRS